MKTKDKYESVKQYIDANINIWETYEKEIFKKVIKGDKEAKSEWSHTNGLLLGLYDVQRYISKLEAKK